MNDPLLGASRLEIRPISTYLLLLFIISEENACQKVRAVINKFSLIYNTFLRFLLTGKVYFEEKTVTQYNGISLQQ